MALRALFFLSTLLFALAFSGPAAAQGAADPKLEAKLEDIRKQQKAIAKSVSGAKAVVDIAKLTRRSEILNTLSSVLGKVSEGASAAGKLFKALEVEEDVARRQRLLAKSKLPDWMRLALNPGAALEKVAHEVQALAVPVFDCTDGECVSPADLLGDRNGLLKKARRQLQQHQEVVEAITELNTFCGEVAKRARAASQALNAMARGWEQAMELGCGVLGSYCGLNWVEALELARQCNGVAAAAESKQKQVAQALKLERQRLTSWTSWVALVGVEPTK